MKKLLMFVLLCTATHFVYAAPAEQADKKIKLAVTFDWAQPSAPFDAKPIHVEKNLALDPKQQGYSIVMTQSKMVKDRPVTLMLLAKPVTVAGNQIKVKYLLYKYSATEMGTVIAKPEIMAVNGTTSEMALLDKTLKFKTMAEWVV